LIVLDSSAAIDFVTRGASFDWLDARLAEAGTVHAPHLFDVEVVAGLRKLLIRGAIGVTRAEASLARLRRLRVDRHCHLLLVERIWELRDNVTPYDAAYIALAEALAAPLLTTDRRLARTPGLPVDVIAP
jgi:predicted nucleic acid-binding protein